MRFTGSLFSPIDRLLALVAFWESKGSSVCPSKTTYRPVSCDGFIIQLVIYQQGRHYRTKCVDNSMSKKGEHSSNIELVLKYRRIKGSLEKSSPRYAGFQEVVVRAYPESPKRGHLSTLVSITLK